MPVGNLLKKIFFSPGKITLAEDVMMHAFCANKKGANSVITKKSFKMCFKKYPSFNSIKLRL